MELLKQLKIMEFEHVIWDLTDYPREKFVVYNT